MQFLGTSDILRGSHLRFGQKAKVEAFLVYSAYVVRYSNTLEASMASSSAPWLHYEDVQSQIVPILTVHGPREDLRPDTIEGTGVFPVPRVFVTCWHCVALPRAYVAMVRVPGGDSYSAWPLLDITQHPNGCDLAMARVALTHTRQLVLSIADNEALAATEVWSYGYPFSTVLPGVDGDNRARLEGRYLQGYITQAFRHEHHRYGMTMAYELDMPTPEGLSGAPLLKRNTREIIGVVYGTNDVALIERFSEVDQEGKRTPEIQRVVSFGLAHHTSNLQSLAGPATNGKTLAEYIRTPGARAFGPLRSTQIRPGPKG